MEYTALCESPDGSDAEVFRREAEHRSQMLDTAQADRFERQLIDNAQKKELTPQEIIWAYTAADDTTTVFSFDGGTLRGAVAL